MQVKGDEEVIQFRPWGGQGVQFGYPEALCVPALAAGPAGVRFKACDIEAVY